MGKHRHGWQPALYRCPVGCDIDAVCQTADHCHRCADTRRQPLHKPAAEIHSVGSSMARAYHTYRQDIVQPATTRRIQHQRSVGAVMQPRRIIGIRKIGRIHMAGLRKVSLDFGRLQQSVAILTVEYSVGKAHDRSKLPVGSLEKSLFRPDSGQNLAGKHLVDAAKLRESYSERKLTAVHIHLYQPLIYSEKASARASPRVRRPCSRHTTSTLALTTGSPPGLRNIS